MIRDFFVSIHEYHKQQVSPGIVRVRAPQLSLPGYQAISSSPPGGHRCGEHRRGARPLPASMTVEAALVLPLFLFFVMSILSLFDLILLRTRVETALWQTGEEICEEAYYPAFLSGEDGQSAGALREAASLLGQAQVRGRVRQRVGGSRVLVGEVRLSQVQLGAVDGEVVLVADYRAAPFFRLLPVSPISLRSTYVGHAWIGELPQNQREQAQTFVYITAHGSVYHKSPGCTYLTPAVRSVPAASLSALRNDSGGKYYPCRICHAQARGTVWVTGTGNRYHSRRDCSAIFHRIFRVPLSQVEGTMRPCSKCGK